MKKIYILLILLFSFASLTAQPTLTVDMLDGSQKSYNLYDLEDISFEDADPSWLFFIYYDKTDMKFYPLSEIQQITLENEDIEPVKLLVHLGNDEVYDFRLDLIDSMKIQQIQTKISDDVILIDSLNTNSLVEVLQDKILFDNSKVKADKIEPGKIIVCGITTNAPYGFMRKVVSSTVNGDNLEVTTTVPEISEAIEEGYAHHRMKISTDDTVSMKVEKGVTVNALQAGGFRYSIDDYVLYENGPVSITLDGTFSVDPNVFFDFVIQDLELKSLRFDISVDERLDVRITGNVEGEFDRSSVLATWNIRPVTVMVGWIPLVITSKIDLEIGADGELHLEVTTAAEQSAHASAGIIYLHGNWYPIHHFENNYDYFPPELTEANARARAWLGPKYIISLYDREDFINTYAYIRGFLELNLDLLEEPCLLLEAGLEANAGIAAPFLGDDIEFSFENPYELRFNLFEYNCELELERAEPNPACPGSAITLFGSGFGVQRGENYVTLDGEQIEEYLIWNDEQISFIVPTSFNAGDAVVHVNDQSSDPLQLTNGGCEFEIIQAAELVDFGLDPPYISKDGTSVIYVEQDINADEPWGKIWYIDVNSAKNGGSPRMLYHHVTDDWTEGLRIVSVSDDNRKVIFEIEEVGFYLLDTRSGDIQQLERAFGITTGIHGHYFPVLDYNLTGNGRSIIFRGNRRWGWESDWVSRINNNEYECWWKSPLMFNLERYQEPHIQSRIHDVNYFYTLDVDYDGNTIWYSRPLSSKGNIIYRATPTSNDSLFLHPSGPRAILVNETGTIFAESFPFGDMTYYNERGEYFELPNSNEYLEKVVNVMGFDREGNYILLNAENEASNSNRRIYRVRADDQEVIPIMPFDYFESDGIDWWDNYESTISADGQTVATYVFTENYEGERHFYVYVIRGISYQE